MLKETENQIPLQPLPEIDNTNDPEARAVATFSKSLATLLNLYESDDHPWIIAAIVTQAAIRLHGCPTCLTRGAMAQAEAMFTDAPAMTCH
ncbi:hypothetical protein [Thiorhodovibrio frisius]|uniref:Uncharacterized protein n=1 Tax=Thiorhodovibrio frisius TaxID=631362 RepID=H8Z5F9_9GAMM|nr:hypothetical protein [Thiorhodovibrio frisius]EIC19505.1 hypothetical protein Thi970DRAFT_03083 [Thiorhodovibrio frisius]WPL20532.1 hypothetical protein Thiofri_00631 [Thiorhodovibrio frisius]